MQKKLLFISRHAPYGNPLAREALDAALTAAVYEQEVHILFMDDGVFQLLKDQNGKNIAQKNLSAIVSALPFYDIENVYVHRESLEQRRIALDELAIESLTVLNNHQVAELMGQQTHILSF